MQKLTVAALAVVAALGLTLASTQAQAATYVGSWEVDDGPSWTTDPTAYTGQAAAALLFGGTASDYVISTVDSNPADINGLTWVSTWGGACDYNFPCGTQVADNYVVTENGLYVNPGDTSAYVADWAVGSQYTNYAFFVGTPEPATWAMMMLGLGLTGAFLRRRAHASLRPPEARTTLTNG